MTPKTRHWFIRLSGIQRRELLDNDGGGNVPTHRHTLRGHLDDAMSKMVLVHQDVIRNGAAMSTLTEEDSLVLLGIAAMASEAAAELARIRWAQSPGNAKRLKLADRATAQTMLDLEV
jgi:hypothetical protein